MDAAAEGTPPARASSRMAWSSSTSVADRSPTITSQHADADARVGWSPRDRKSSRRGEYLRMPRDKRSALWDSSEGARERAASRICAWQSTASDSDHASTKDQYASGLSSAKNSAVSRSVDVAWDTRKGAKSVSERREEPSWGGGRGRRDRTTTEDRAAGDAIASRVVILGRTGQSAVSVMLTPLFASCDAAAHTHATVTASASAPSNRMVAHRRVALCRSSRRRTRARTRLAWTTRGETRRLPRSVDLRNERCPVFHVTPTRGDSRPPPSLLTPSSSLSPRHRLYLRSILLLLPLDVTLPAQKELRHVHDGPSRVGTVVGKHQYPASPRGAHAPSPRLPRTPSRPPCRSWDPSGRARDPTAPFPLHVRTSRGTDRTCAWIDPRFPRRTFGGPRAARVAPPVPGTAETACAGGRRRGRGARGGHRFETHRRRRCLVRWRARGPRGPTRRRRRIGSSTRRCTPTSAPPRGPPPSVPPPPRGTVPEDRRPRTSPPHRWERPRARSPAREAAWCAGRGPETRGKSSGKEGFSPPPSPSPTCRAPEEIEAPTPRAPPTPLASVRGGPHRVHWRARRTTPSPRPAPPPRGRRPLARARAPSPPDPPRRDDGGAESALVRGVHVGTRGDERANRRDVTQRGGGS